MKALANNQSSSSYVRILDLLFINIPAAINYFRKRQRSLPVNQEEITESDSSRFLPPCLIQPGTGNHSVCSCQN